MKRILITGANSYIGTSFESYIKQWPEKYQVDTIDMIDGSWREKSFAGYDAVFHVAGIAHMKETRKNASLYYMVNRNLAVETAQKAKKDGVKQFVFLSSMNVYGLVTGTITPSTIPTPKSNYGRSKLQAEQLLSQLTDDDFILTILRPPMVYGPGCRGNYQALIKYAKRLPLFPDYQNQRSMIEIKRLCQYLKDRIDKKQKGIFFPQDDNYACTTQIVREIAVQNNYTIYFTKFFNPVIRILKIRLIKKVFGDLIYKGMV